MSNYDNQVITRLRDLRTIREQAGRLLELGRAKQLNHFSLDESRLADTAQFVTEVMLENYPDLDIPYHSRWRHFEAGGHHRVQQLRTQLSGSADEDMGNIFFELAIISVLLDAGAGHQWKFFDQKTGRNFSRSEGLAIASFEWYMSGGFSCTPQQPYRVDYERLQSLRLVDLKEAFQVSKDNPLEGLEGRLQLLNQLGDVLVKSPQFFGIEARLGHFYQHITTQLVEQRIPAHALFTSVLLAFTDVWPKRLHYQGVPLGDVWTHSQLKSDRVGSEYIPFHKLSQWLTYSLIEPLEWSGVVVTHLDALTGLPEYRNGGLFIDMGVLQPRHEDILIEAQDPGSEVVVEWRALTVSLLDELAYRIRDQLQCDEQVLPLARILQGGSWDAGRKTAAKLRQGTPPITIISDGTIF
ncbi:URC4/urg3 family protein [Legionella spiritensis]|uniref:Putative biotin synthetase like protein n=1 Tax=Legionella spiritensis TaxID=452 RepID=A0A0W0Z5Z1_LEGSP|nr:URC4/urg3 family protein [Legionella spiritensis]KTD64554.1 putative biotin synthetase like protein [Legionella spiritensis]SNV29790.1 putative biotin synthetase like protein [Legionella spiritensis]